MEENPFRILLDFRELNFKFYKFVWMSISPRELVSIKDLKEAILRKFSFERADLLLFLRDGLLPEDENISNILRENDNVRLFYAEPSDINLNDSKAIIFEADEESANEDQVKSPKKRKEHSDASEDSKQMEYNKKRKHSFSNGTYLHKNNTSESSAVISAVSDDLQIDDPSVYLYNFETNKRKSHKIKKKLKYSHDVSQNSITPMSEISLSTDITPMSEKSQSKVNFCKKKKKHKHSKDISESEIDHDDSLKMSEINESKSGLHKKKKKHKKSNGASTSASVSELAVSFSDEIMDAAENFKYSVNDLEAENDQSELGESVFQTAVSDDSEILKLVPVTPCASSGRSSSGIGWSLKTSAESNQKMSAEESGSKSGISDSQALLGTEEPVIQGNNCKKKKRKRHRKRKPTFMSPHVDVSNDCSLKMSPETNQNLGSISMSTEFSSRSNANVDISKPSAFNSKDNGCYQTQGFLPNSSTPYPQTHAKSCASPPKNVFLKPYNSLPSQDQTSSVVSSLHTIVPASKNRTDENSLSTHSSPCNVTKNQNNATVPNHNNHEKNLSAKINNFNKPSDSISDKGIKNQFQETSFSYKSCPPLNSCPLVGTHIAYKMLELDSSYSPVVSSYKEGIVRTVNSQTDELEIELIEPEVKEGRIGKFENLYRDEIPSCEVVRKVTLSWTSLIDPVQVVY